MNAKAFSVGPDMWALVERRKAIRELQRQQEAEAIRAIKQENREAERLDRAVNRKEGRRG